MRHLAPTLLLLTLAFCGHLAAKGGFEGGRPDHPLFLAGNAYYAIISPDGVPLKEWKGANNNDGWILPDGHLLGATGDAIEWDAEGREVWHYKAQEQKGGGIYSCQRLPNGDTLIGENSTGRIYARTPDGQTHGLIQVPLNERNRHQTLRMVRRYPDGVTLVCRSGANTVELYNAEGALTWQQKVPGLAFAALRDPEGNIYIASLGQVQKWSPEHSLLWELKASETGLPIRNMTGLHLLPNGNLIIGCYGYGNGIGAFEVTPEKKIRWTYRSGRANDSHMAVQLLDPAIQTPLR